MSGLHYLSLADLCRRLKSGELSAVAVTEHMLARIEEHNDALHCYTLVLADAALADARRLDDLRRAGEPLGPLHGVPIGLKDLLQTQGITTASGTLVMANHVPVADATVVTKLAAAGAVVLGKLQLTEGAYGSHHPDLAAPVNPWNADLWPGVSSSGSGVSVASGLAFGALGSDTGGSIRFPSAANGVVGIKPTYGRVSRHGAFPLAESLDHIGPLARSVEDAARMLQVIAGYDAQDANSLNLAVPNYLATMRDSIEGLKIGVDWTYTETGVAPEVVGAVRQAVDVYRELGATIVEVTLPNDYLTLVRNWVITCGVECALAHSGMYPEQKALYGPDFSNLLDLGLKSSAVHYASLERVRERFRRNLDELFEGVDVLLCPNMPSLPPPLAEMSLKVSDTDEAADFITFTAPFDYSGHPTITLPAGLSTNGVPNSVQLVGRTLDEATLVRAGYAYEQSLGFSERPLP